MTSTEILTLRQFVRANLAEGMTNYHAEAERLVSLMPEADRDSYLVQALIGVLNEINGQRRREAFDMMPDDAPETSDAGPLAQRDPLTSRSASDQNFARNEAHRAFWMELRDSVGLAAGGGRKRVGDMTAADLRANIEHREKLAAENQHRAEQFRRLLKMLETAGVETVDQIGGTR